jgi:hypothetical protein
MRLLAGAFPVRKGIFLMAALSAGCAYTYPILEVGDNSFQISAIPSAISRDIAGAKNLAISRANRKCESLDKRMTVTKVETGHAYPASDGILVIFACT